MTITIKIPDDTRNGKLVASFANYCKANPQQRFWQALRNWSEYAFVFASNDGPEELIDTFYFEGKRD